MNGRVLIVAGSDSGGGAGLQADLKTVTCLGGYAMTAVTALTAQDTCGVQAVLPVPADFVARQMRVVLDDIGADAVKLGMLHNAGIVEAVADVLDEHPELPVVLDPVMVAESGDRLLDADAVDGLRRRLLPRAVLVTPNLPEAAALLGQDEIDGPEAQQAAARDLLEAGCRAVLLKGGHACGDQVDDVLATPDDIHVLSHRRIDTPCTHGTGCTLAAAIAAGLAQGIELPRAVRRASRYLQKALATATPVGRGHGPVNHAHTVQRFDD
jgi:hydroxymethylpyrimidine/phosphomethylpyrimidine kinase